MEMIDFYIYRPITMASKKCSYSCSRNGNAKECTEQTMFMNSYNNYQPCIEMSNLTLKSLNLEMFFHLVIMMKNLSLKKDATFNPSEKWTFNIIFRILDYLKEKLDSEEINYTLNGIDAGGSFVSYFHFFTLIEDSRKQLPKNLL